MSNEVIVPGTGTSINLGDLSPSIAAELAAELAGPEDIRAKYGLTKGQWDRLRQNPVFRAMVLESLKTFRGSLAAGARITKKAEILLEDALPDLYAIAKAKDVPVDGRIKAINQLAELAGRGKGSGQSDPNAPKIAGFTLNINVGGDQPVTITASPNVPSDV
jgi:hypothetical protein